jgi:hypothetical protein
MMLELSPEIEKRIEGFVRGGAAPLSAARAAGVDADTYARWTELASAGSAQHHNFQKRIEMAEAETRAAAEIELRRKSPKSWLQPTRSAIAPVAKGPYSSTRKRDQQVRRFAARVRSLAPHIDNPIFAPLLATFARISIMLERGYAFLRDQDLVGADGELRPSVDAVRRLAETQTRLARELGLTPLTLRVLSQERPVDLAAEMARQIEETDGE